MKSISLKQRLFIPVFNIMFFLVLGLSLVGFYLVKTYIMDQAQEQVTHDLSTVRVLYEQPIETMKLAFSFFPYNNNLDTLQKTLGLDYLFVLDKSADSFSEIVQQCNVTKEFVGGTRIISEEQLQLIDNRMATDFFIPILYTPKARVANQRHICSVMAIEAAYPLLNESDQVEKVIVGGVILNKKYGFIDRISKLVFKEVLFNEKPIGTVTIFQDDVRITTNVVDAKGDRAIGTRVSEKVYNKVVQEKQKWLNRAFVVTDWYISAYEPITNIKGDIIGILYVGILEKPYYIMGRNIFLGFFGVILVVALLGVVFILMFAKVITNPLMQMIDAIYKLAQGNRKSHISLSTGIRELNSVIHAFNDMAKQLGARETDLEDTNQELACLNKSYLDLIGFVSHELKGVLGSTLFTIYTLKDGYIGKLAPQQLLLVNSIAKNLDYLVETVKNFLSLSRIEKAELSVQLTEVNLKNEIVAIALESFQGQLQAKKMKVQSIIDEGFCVYADSSLLKVVFNNLLSNAIKYGKEKGEIKILAEKHESRVQVAIFNEAIPLTTVEITKLFQKFSRVINEASKREKGTGLGLFITKEIIEQHGGTIWVEPRENGNTFIFTLPLA